MINKKEKKKKEKKGRCENREEIKIEKVDGGDEEREETKQQWKKEDVWQEGKKKLMKRKCKVERKKNR